MYETLKEEYYEWPNLGPGSVAGVYSPAVVIFKDDLDHDCKDLPVDKREVVSVITVSAPRVPDLTPDRLKLANESDLEDFRGKIRLVYRMAGHNGQHALILGGGDRDRLTCSGADEASRCDGMWCLHVSAPSSRGRDEVRFARGRVRRVVQRGDFRGLFKQWDWRKKQSDLQGGVCGVVDSVVLLDHAGF